MTDRIESGCVVDERHDQLFTFLHDFVKILSDAFPIRSGVVQGDILSSLYFVLVLDLTLRKHDQVEGKRIDFGGRR